VFHSTFGQNGKKKKPDILHDKPTWVLLQLKSNKITDNWWVPYRCIKEYLNFCKFKYTRHYFR